MTGAPRAVRSVNIAMAITIARTPAPLALPVLAYFGLRWWFIGLIAAVWALDWLDGKLARILDQHSRLGAQLDSLGDALLFGAMIPSLYWLRPDFLRDDWIFIAAAVGSYGLAMAIGIARFGRPPSYHTRAAKICALLVAAGAVILFADGPAWPVRIALVAVTGANIESILISLALREARTDVASIFCVWPARRNHAAPRSEPDASEECP